MNGIDSLEMELDYLKLESDVLMTESVEESDDSESKVHKIKAQFNTISTHLDDAMFYIHDYIDTKKSGEVDTDYEKRLKGLILQAQKAMDMDSESISVYDNRSVMDKYNKITDHMFDDLDRFITSRAYKDVDEVISKRDALHDIIKNFDESMKNDLELKVWISPATVKRVCIDALNQGPEFNRSLKNVYMNVTRLNNKVANIVKDGSLDSAVKTELIQSSLKLTREMSSFCIRWDKHLLSYYPMVKA